VTVSTTDADLESAWRDHRRWSNTATGLRRSIAWWRTVALIAAVLGAAMATFAVQIGLQSQSGMAVSLGAAVVLAVVPTVRGIWLSRGRLESWARARSASEGIKAEVYLYLTASPPYDGAERATELGERVNAIVAQVDDLAGVSLGRRVDDKPPPLVRDVETYLTLRVQPQIDEYYRPRAETLHKRLRYFRWAEYSLAFIGALLSAVAGVAQSGLLGVWVAVVTTIGAAITAHIAAARYEHLVITYMATARQLRFLVQRWSNRVDPSPTEAGDFVRDCEDVISRENESWMVAWSGSDS
jgi:hypothetical protein